MSGALLAVCYLTIVPLARRRQATMRDLGAAAPWFPVVGAVLGSGLAAFDMLGVRMFPPLLSALLTVTAWKVLTGGLHLDGLADCLDGFGGQTPDERRAIMHDSRIGSFAAIGLILFLMLEVTALGELPRDARWGALVAAPTIGRAVPALLARLLAAARGAGHGARFSAGVSALAAPVALGVALVVAAAVLGGAGIVALAAGGGAAVALGAWLARRLDGVTGDVLGACVEVAELTVLLTLAAWTHARS